MIRTHRPRGYAWTCASLFQQTPCFRNISYEDCEVEDSQTDGFAPSERAAKRQRIEKLADDFLNGQALNITSARLTPQGFQNAVARSFGRPKDARRAMAEIEATSSADASAEVAWEDLQDQWEIMQRFNLSSDVEEGNDHDMPMQAAEFGDEEVTVEVHAQASCTSSRRQRLVKLATGPSDEALRQAAALRNRTLLRRSGRLSAPSLLHAQSEGTVAETQEDSASSSLQASMSIIGPTPTAAWTSSKWLKSGMFEPRRKAVDEECSKDELGLSSLPTPSQKATARPAFGLRRGRSALSQQSTDATNSFLSANGQALYSSRGVRQSSNGATEVSHQMEATGYVPEPSNDQAGEDVPASNEESQGDSQAQLLRQQGIRAAPRKSWASFGATTERSADHVAPPEPLPHDQPAVSSAVRESIQESARLNAGKTFKGKRTTKSTGAAPSTGTTTNLRRSSRRKSAPSESQAAANSMADLPVDQQRGMGSFRAGERSYISAPGKDSSPFLFRKRASKFNDSENPDLEPLAVESKQRRPRNKIPKRVDVPFDIPQPLQTEPIPAPAVADPKTPMVNEYLNRLLPKTGEYGSRSSSVRKALRDEMRLAGAEFSRVEGELSSSQGGPVAFEGQTGHSSEEADNASVFAAEPAPERPPPQIWPGTQILLAEAQKDLFNSPNKENTTMYLGDKTTPQTMKEVPQRQPLRALSQEQLPMPSTQALLDGWQGWSSIKKPRSTTGKRSSLLPSPSANRGSSESSLTGANPVASHSFDETGFRKSSLRHSISYSDSPNQQQTESLPVAAFFPASQPELGRSISKPPFDLSIANGSFKAANAPDLTEQRHRRPSGGIASSAAFSQGQFLSTTEPNTISSLSNARSSSTNHPAPPPQQQHKQQESSISFSPVMRSQAREDESIKQSTKPIIIASKPPAAGPSVLLNDQDSWSFSPLAKQPESEKRASNIDSTTEVGSPATPFAQYQQAQNPVIDDASGCFLRNVDVESQELDFSVTDFAEGVLGSARRGMPSGTGVFSQ